ncbi:MULTISPECIES: 1-aminocyclopropane-1-carboxylate deaminase/D-cysteine desulfhydrase [Flammeovirga]|uniref:1-aminocyclopropane-1-carboxylate deaminase/D-cysteine desulfhydrase n=1 Tax=Flammeovirga agarivorans TaxID=2726742 RepID=A0A7X8SMF4_9BACT|nr:MULTISPECIES: pyridoxal-phosphate dependent enzyme [Flammeovirga]NLR92860.1 1-aminocyclopropane-1-carboxylate deaminase/D-cysteine desulfhydrase [Flammeovirga agarivorans]
MESLPKENTPMQEIKDPVLIENGVRLFVKRDDLTHPEVSGNKWRKLKYNLLKAKEDGYDTILTFGGAYSNHIHAFAAAGKLYGLKTIGVIRGEEHLPLNPTLAFAKSQGMQLTYLDRTSFRDYRSAIPQLKNTFGDFYMAPMGGSNDLALAGVAELGEELNQFDHNIDYLCAACGTGGTLAGLITSISSETKVIGFPALKGGDFLYEDINEFISSVKGRNSFPEWTLNLEYHFGGYAKKKPELMEFMALFNQKYNIELERIYTGKMMFGVFDMIKKGLFPKGSNIVALHSGGLQINRS